ncbi:ankyrin, partial [Massarina eburnea CBS 473.64]
ALHWAASEGKAEAVEFLLDHGADIEAKCSRGRTPLILAAEAGHEQVAKVLCTHGANLNTRSRNGGTCLTWAACRNHVEVLEFLLAQKVDIEAQDNKGHTALSLSAHFGHLKIHSPSMLPVLIENGANVHASYKSEASALHAAAAEGNLEALEFLIGLGMDMEKQTLKGYTPLACSLTWGQEKVALALLKAGADATWTTRQQYQTALHFAASNGMKDAVVEILKQPVQVNARDKHGWTALNEVCTKNTKGTLGIVSALLDAGANIELPHPNGDHPLHIALANENEEVAELLIDRGASITALGSRSRTPLHIAADLHLSSITYRLLSANVTTEAIDSDSWTPLCCVSYAPIAHQLIKHGANVNYADRDGWTPLHQAVYHGDVDVARILVMEGADVKAR